MERSIQKEHINTVIIEGRSYLLDMDMHAIIEEKDKNDPRHFLRYKNLDYDGEFFTFIYNQNTGKIEDNTYANIMKLPPGILRVKIPVGFAFGRKFSPDQLDRFNDLGVFFRWNSVFLGEMYNQRLEGTRPRLEMGGNYYVINHDQEALINLDRSVMVKLNQFRKETINGKTFYTGLFDLVNQHVLKDKIIKQEFGESIIQVKFPELRVLDPVGVALKEGKEAYAYLHENPLFRMQSAEIVAIRQLEVKKGSEKNDVSALNLKKKQGMKK